MLENIFFWIIIIFISTYIEWNVLTNLLYEIIKPKNSRLTINITKLIFIVTITFININEFNPVFKILIYPIFIYIFVRYNYYSSIKKSIIICLVYMMGLAFIHEIVYALLFVISSNLVYTYNSYYRMYLLVGLTRLELILITKVILLLAVPIIHNIKSGLRLRVKDYIYTLVFLTANVVSTLIVFGSLYRFTYGITNLFTDIIIIFISLVVLTSGVFTIKLMNKIILDNKIMLENSIMKENMERQYMYYTKLQEVQLKTRELYHDMNNHMICIQSIYGDDDITNKYIEGINNKLKSCNYGYSTGNIILDVILNEKKTICDEKDIEFIAEVNFSKCDFIEMVDVCSIFSNIIDNAIEACIKVESKCIKRIIKLNANVISRLFVIKCENSKENNVIIRENSIFTSKNDKFLHGIGIRSVKSSVEKYNGNLELNIFDNKFVASIYIPTVHI